VAPEEKVSPNVRGVPPATAGVRLVPALKSMLWCPQEAWYWFRRALKERTVSGMTRQSAFTLAELRVMS
jgi:hypothetical protein